MKRKYVFLFKNTCDMTLTKLIFTSSNVGHAYSDYLLCHGINRSYVPAPQPTTFSAAFTAPNYCTKGGRTIPAGINLLFTTYKN